MNVLRPHQVRFLPEVMGPKNVHRCFEPVGTQATTNYIKFIINIRILTPLIWGIKKGDGIVHLLYDGAPSISCTTETKTKLPPGPCTKWFEITSRRIDGKEERGGGRVRRFRRHVGNEKSLFGNEKSF